MPIENNIPQIDNRRFDDIVTELRTRIPRYTPEWTDLNDNDPGIALAQLLAWLTEMMIYRMNKVPELNYLKFLQLLGVELNPEEPAHAEITLPVLDSHPDPYVIVRERTQVAAESDEGGLIVFETERPLRAIKAQLVSILVHEGYSFSPMANEIDETAQGFNPFGSLANADSALMVGFTEEFPSEIELNLTVWAFEGTSGPSAYNCGLAETRVYPSAQIAWEFYGGREWHPLGLLKDETLGFSRSGHVYLKTPQKGRMQREKFAESEELYWIRARLERGIGEKLPKLLTIKTNTVEAIQAETVRDEVLGGSDGRPNQTFRLANRPVLHDTLVLEVDQGEIEPDAEKQWTRVDDFFGSKPNDQHYVLNRTTGEIHCGDGRNGAIPVGNVENPGANVVAREYRFGGGKHGNVVAGKIATLLTSIAGIDENGIKNLRAAHSGRDEESLGEAKERARHSIKSRCRAVTDEDFEQLAMQASNIKRAKALPLYHPTFPEVEVPGVVTVIVVPDSDQSNPIPSEGTLRTVCAYLNQRRLLTTEVYVVKPRYNKVEIDVEVIANNSADLAEVTQAIEKNLLEYFHPLKGGEDGLGWPFGGDIFFSRVFQQVFKVPGVQRIERLLIKLDGEEAPECKDVPIPKGTLVYSTQHDVRVNYAFDE